MKKFRKSLVTGMMVTGLTLPMAAMATNGYFAHGYGTKNKGLVGGGVALPQDAMIAATNPAGMVYVGERMDLGAAIFSPSPRGYTATNPVGGGPFPLAPQSAESDSDYFLIPHFAYNWSLSPDRTVGLTVYGNGGMNTDYSATQNVFGAGEAGVNLEQLFINASYSMKVNPTNAFGVSAILAYQRFEAKGLASFNFFNLSSDPANLTNNGVDTSTGYGLKLGWITDIGNGVKLAASYQTEMDMSKFDKYKGLFAEQGDFDIPATWTVGLAWDVKPKNTVTFDVQKIMYSDIASIGNPMLPALGACFFGDTTQCLGTDNGPGFGWKDMTIYKLGYQFETSSNMSWRVGYSHGDQPIPDSEVLFNILAPGIMEDHFTFGFTRDMGKDAEFNFAMMYSPENTVTGLNPLDGQQVTLKMTQYEVEASWSWKY